MKKQKVKSLEIFVIKISKYLLNSNLVVLFPKGPLLYTNVMNYKHI
jgi:hypothetical protein